jgi:hypothetical protein
LTLLQDSVFPLLRKPVENTILQILDIRTDKPIFQFKAANIFTEMQNIAPRTNNMIIRNFAANQR